MATTQLTSVENSRVSRAVVKTASLRYTTALADVELVPAVAGKRIVLLSLLIGTPASGQSWELHSGPSSGGDGVVFGELELLGTLPTFVENPAGLCHTETGSALILAPGVAGSTAALSGHLTYVEV